jgi:hypothetical protein
VTAQGKESNNNLLHHQQINSSIGQPSFSGCLTPPPPPSSQQALVQSPQPTPGWRPCWSWRRPAPQRRPPSWRPPPPPRRQRRPPPCRPGRRDPCCSGRWRTGSAASGPGSSRTRWGSARRNAFKTSVSPISD